jgi:4-carboxymuconolactone decarboxylase
MSADGEGMAIRRQVLGADYVDAALANATEFSQPLQEFLADHCWGNVWLREGLSLQMRSVVTLTVLACGGKWNEFRSHVRGGLRNGLTPDELREIFLHIAVYAGVPVAVEAFRHAGDVVHDWTAGTASDED